MKDENYPTVKVVNRHLDGLIPYARNARTHSKAQVAAIAASLCEFGWTAPVLLDGQSGILAGHGRVSAARLIVETGRAIPHWPDPALVPTIDLGHLTATQRRAYVLTDNRLAEMAGWDSELLALELADLQQEGFSLELAGFSALDVADLTSMLEPDKSASRASSLSLAERFMVPPFSVLDARQGWWRNRKRAWIDFGLESESGRDAQLLFARSAQPPAVYDEKYRLEKALGREMTWAEFSEEQPSLMLTGTSVFDPVLCELAYRWFCPPGGQVLDPFAGGSVRGVVAAALGRSYAGCDLRSEQVEANRVQWAEIKQSLKAQIDADVTPPSWICGDSANLTNHYPGLEADFVFSCPPYADLEVYSDDPADISTMAYPEFLETYRRIIDQSISMLKPDRFAAFVVGDMRDKDGFCRGFVGATVSAFEAAGVRFYNEAILVTPAASLAVRAARPFEVSRKIGRQHQHLLVFVKGDARKATQVCGLVELAPDLFTEALD